MVDDSWVSLAMGNERRPRLLRRVFRKILSCIDFKFGIANLVGWALVSAPLLDWYFSGSRIEFLNPDSIYAFMSDMEMKSERLVFVGPVSLVNKSYSETNDTVSRIYLRAQFKSEVEGKVEAKCVEFDLEYLASVNPFKPDANGNILNVTSPVQPLTIKGGQIASIYGLFEVAPGRVGKEAKDKCARGFITNLALHAMLKSYDFVDLVFTAELVSGKVVSATCMVNLTAAVKQKLDEDHFRRLYCGVNRS